MPVMYHFRVDKVIDSVAEQGMYKKLVNDLNASQWNDFFEFDAKAKDMKDGEGNKFRFTAKVKQAGDIPIETYKSQFQSLAEHLQSNYGISLHDATTQQAKLKNAILTSNKTITQETFNELTDFVNSVIRKPIAIEATIEKMASMWIDDKKNIFTEAQRLYESKGLKQTSEQLSVEQEALNSAYQDAVRQQEALTATKAEIEGVVRQLDNSQLPESAKAIVEEIRNAAIPAKVKVKEIKYKTLDKNSYADYKAIADVNALVLGIDAEKLEQQIYHQHISKTMLGTKSTKTPAEQEFAKAYFKHNIERAIEHISENTINALMENHARVDEQFLNITKTQKAIEQQKPNDTAAERVVANNELAKLKHALAVQHAFEAQYTASNAVKHDIDATAPSEIQRSENIQRRVATPDQTDSEASMDSRHDSHAFTEETIPMYHYRIQQPIPTESKAAFDDLTAMLTKNYKGQLFEFICKTYNDEPDKPTRFMLKINQKGIHSTSKFNEQLTAILKTCAIHGVDVHAFEGLGSKQEFTLGKKGSYVTEDGTKTLTAILKTIQENMPKEAFEIAQNLLPQHENNNDFKKISRLANDRAIEHERLILASEKSYLETELAQVQRYEAINNNLQQQLKDLKANIEAIAPSNKHLASSGFVLAKAKADSFAKKREALPIDPKIKHPIASRSTYPELDSIMKYNTLLSHTSNAHSVLMRDAIPHLATINHKGVFSSEDKMDPIAHAMFETQLADAILTAKDKLDTLKSEQEQTIALFEEANNKVGLKAQINGKKSAVEIHAENQVLLQELQALQLALELAQGMQKTQAQDVVENEGFELNLATPPLPTFSPEDQVIIQEVATDVVNSAMRDALANVMPDMVAKAAAGSSKLANSPTPQNKSMAPPPPPPPPPLVEKNSTTDVGEKKQMTMAEMLMAKQARIEANAKKKPAPPPPPPPPPLVEKNSTTDVGEKKQMTMAEMLMAKQARIEANAKKKPAPPPPPPPQVEKNPTADATEEKQMTIAEMLMAKQAKISADSKRKPAPPPPPPPVENKTTTDVAHPKPMSFTLLNAIHKGATLKPAAKGNPPAEKESHKKPALKIDLQEQIRQASNSRRASTSEVIDKEQADRKQKAIKEDTRRNSLAAIQAGVTLKKAPEKEPKSNDGLGSNPALNALLKMREHFKPLERDDDELSEISGFSDDESDNEAGNDYNGPGKK